METNHFLVLQTDFGLKDGAVSAMHGVAHLVAPHVAVSDLTHVFRLMIFGLHLTASTRQSNIGKKAQLLFQ